MAGDLETTLQALESAKVRYLVVGGVAVVLHGHLRVTADLDLVVELEPANVARAIAALERLGFRPRAPVAASQFADEETREAWIREKGLTVFSLWSPQHAGFEVDLFVREPFDFDEVHSRALRVPLETCEVTVISREDLIALKLKSGRPRDQEDVLALRALEHADAEK